MMRAWNKCLVIGYGGHLATSGWVTILSSNWGSRCRGFFDGPVEPYHQGWNRLSSTMYPPSPDRADLRELTRVLREIREIDGHLIRLHTNSLPRLSAHAQRHTCATLRRLSRA